jgi:hypothetical protein
MINLKKLSRSEILRTAASLTIDHWKSTSTGGATTTTKAAASSNNNKSTSGKTMASSSSSGSGGASGSRSATGLMEMIKGKKPSSAGTVTNTITTTNGPSALSLSLAATTNQFGLDLSSTTPRNAATNPAGISSGNTPLPPPSTTTPNTFPSFHFERNIVQGNIRNRSVRLFRELFQTTTSSSSSAAEITAILLDDKIAELCGIIPKHAQLPSQYYEIVARAFVALKQVSEVSLFYLFISFFTIHSLIRKKKQMKIF